LIPAHPETRIFQTALRECRSVVFVWARLRFGTLRANRRQEAASHGSALFGFGIDVSPLGDLGVAMIVARQSVVDHPAGAGGAEPGEVAWVLHLQQFDLTPRARMQAAGAR
jgi:hypothetical protein